MQVYRARKKLQNQKIGLNLTQRRKDLLFYAQTCAKTNQINGRLGLKLKQGGFKFINTKDELHTVLNQC